MPTENLSMKYESLVIAVDFDGTIVEDQYPRIGKPIIFAFDTMKKLQEKGHRIILWTYRKGSPLDEAVAFCKQNGINFYAVNNSFPEEEFDGTYSRKIHADIFIDDRNFGGMKDWGEIYLTLVGDNNDQISREKKPKRGWFSFFK